MTEKEAKAKLKEIKKAMEAFPAEIRRQERAHREEMKIKKAFGKLSLTQKKQVNHLDLVITELCFTL